MIKKILFIVGLILSYVSICWGVLLLMITPYRENYESDRFPDLPNLSAFKVYSDADSVMLQNWWYPAKLPSKRAIILLHGLNRYGLNCHARDLANIYNEAGFNVVMPDLRGHGQSEGNHIGIGILESSDMRALIKALVRRGISHGSIGIHGVSYGAAMAILSGAAIPEIGAVIADSSYSDIRRVIVSEISHRTHLPKVFSKTLVPGIDYISKYFYGMDMVSARPIDAIAAMAPRPVLLIHGTHDQRIPASESESLANLSGDSVTLWLRPERGHNEGTMVGLNCDRTSPSRDESIHKITRFFNEAL